VLTANRGLCGGYNGSLVRVAAQRRSEIQEQADAGQTSVSGKRGISAFRYAGIPIEKTYTEFDDQPSFDAVAKIADELIYRFVSGQVDRVDVAYTRFISSSKQVPVVETLLPFAGLDVSSPATVSSSTETQSTGQENKVRDDYEFLPNASAILQEVVPASFRARLFKCFLDAAVSEQIARMVAMKSATENAGDIIKGLSRTYNRARQSKITQEIMEIIGGVEALG
jgi:F-type H+-transporting ATPase subunit gamma